MILDRTKQKARTITGTVNIKSDESTVGKIFRSSRMFSEITGRYGLTIVAGKMTGLFIKDTNIATLTITGLEQRETVPDKWARALKTVSAEYGLECTWEETRIPGDKVGGIPRFSMGSAAKLTYTSPQWDNLKIKEDEVATLPPTPKAAEALHSFGAVYSGLTDRVLMPTPKAANGWNAYTMASISDQISELSGVVSVREITSSVIGEVTVSLWVEEGSFHYAAAQCEITEMLPAGITLQLKAKTVPTAEPTPRPTPNAAKAGKAYRNEYLGGTFEFATEETASSLRSPPSRKILIRDEMDPPPTDERTNTEWVPKPKSYADTPTGTVAFDAERGSIRRHNITSVGLQVLDFKRALHLTKCGSCTNTDLHCPCCGKTKEWPRFHARNVAQLLAQNSGDDIEIEDMKDGIECNCGVRSTYNLEDETIKLEMVE